MIVYLLNESLVWTVVKNQILYIILFSLNFTSKLFAKFVLREDGPIKLHLFAETRHLSHYL